MAVARSKDDLILESGSSGTYCVFVGDSQVATARPRSERCSVYDIFIPGHGITENDDFGATIAVHNGLWRKSTAPVLEQVPEGQSLISYKQSYNGLE